jgi:hypothetical protein
MSKAGPSTSPRYDSTVHRFGSEHRDTDQFLLKLQTCCKILFWKRHCRKPWDANESSRTTESHADTMQMVAAQYNAAHKGDVVLISMPNVHKNPEVNESLDQFRLRRFLPMHNSGECDHKSNSPPDNYWAGLDLPWGPPWSVRIRRRVQYGNIDKLEVTRSRYYNNERCQCISSRVLLLAILR